MTDFKKDVMNFLDLMAMGSIEKIEISVDPPYYVVKTVGQVEDEGFLYDIETGKEIL